MDTLRKPLFLIAAALLLIAFLIEMGSSVLPDTYELPGFGIPYLTLIDGLLLYVVATMGIALIIPERIQGRIQGVITFIVSLIALFAAFGLLLAAFAALMAMISLLLAVPFGTAAYFAGFASFARGAAAVTLSGLMSLKLGFAVCLILAHQRFLENRGLVLLIMTSLLANVLVEFLHGFPPGFLVSIVDALAAVIIAVLALIWSLSFLIFSLPAIVKALRVDRALS
ncbi:MAG: hypothetical protein ACU83N_11245 [Gammaproteobacteria bacterium]